MAFPPIRLAMEPTASEQLTQYPVIGLTILAAIPVVSYALWAEYWGRYLDEARKGSRERGGEEFNRVAELRKIRWAGIYVFVTQALLYLSSAPLRAERPVLAAMIFMASLFLQSQVQYGLERKVHGPEQAPQAAGGQARSGLTAFFWTLLMSGAYLATVWTTAALFAGVAAVTGAGKESMVVAMLVGAAAGIFAGVGLIFGTGALHLRKMLPVSRLEDARLRELFAECFRAARVPEPEFWVIEIDRRRFTNAMMAGFRGGRGWFRPGLFVSRTLIEEFSPEEIRAVVLHEASHSALSHLRRRLWGTLGAVFGTSFALTGALLAAHVFLPAETVGMLRIVLTIASIGMPLWLLRSQGEKHELEADAHAVLELGAGFEDFARALRKMDTLNGASSERRDPRSLLSPAGAHPATERRIFLLARKIEERAAVSTSDERRRAA